MDSVQIFPWTRNLETGIPEIDAQHQRLVQLINLLAEHFACQADLPTVDSILDELVDYAAYHFSAEEALWHGYFPDDAWEAGHKVKHRDFGVAVQGLRARQGSTPTEQLLEEVLSFLTHWLAFHILDSDKRMARAVLLVRSGCALAEAKARSEQWMSGAVKVLVDTVLGMYASLSSSTLRLMKERIAMQRLETRLRLAANVFDNTLESICIVDTAGLILEVNPAFCRMCGRSREEIVSRPLAELKSGLADPRQADAIWQTVGQEGHWSGELQSRAQSGELYAELLSLSTVRDAQDALVSYVAVFSNVGQFIEREQAFRHAATHDALTGLPNRLLFADRLKLALASAERTGASLAVCYVDLDGFKTINDTLGHPAGDEVLREVAGRLTLLLRANDTVARLGGDEFVILASGLNPPDECGVLLDRVLASVAMPFEVADTTVRVSASIGISIYPGDGRCAEGLLQQADQALYEAKRAGKACYRRHRQG